jgi:hypothetical protein
MSKEVATLVLPMMLVSLFAAGSTTNLNSPPTPSHIPSSIPTSEHNPILESIVSFWKREKLITEAEGKQSQQI